jgi:hypothetical protein
MRTILNKTNLEGYLIVIYKLIKISFDAIC